MNSKHKLKENHQKNNWMFLIRFAQNYWIIYMKFHYLNKRVFNKALNTQRNISCKKLEFIQKICQEILECMEMNKNIANR